MYFRSVLNYYDQKLILIIIVPSNIMFLLIRNEVTVIEYYVHVRLLDKIKTSMDINTYIQKHVETSMLLTAHFFQPRGD